MHTTIDRIEEYEAAIKEWEETKPPGSASSLDPFGHYKRKVGGSREVWRWDNLLSMH